MTPHHIPKLEALVETLLAETGVEHLDKRTPTEEELASKYKVDVSVVKRAVADGVKVELEHTSDRAIAKEIALDHLGERLDYYDQLTESESPYEIGYQYGVTATRSRGGSRGAEWHADAKELTGTEREGFIEGFNQALDDNTNDDDDDSSD